MEEEKHSLQSLQERFNALIWEQAGKPSRAHYVRLDGNVFEVRDMTRDGKGVNKDGTFVCTDPTLQRIARLMGGKLLS